MKLFCTFIDFSQAFDSVWRTGLWQKLLKTGINGKFFSVIYNMYQHIKSCVSFIKSYSPFFKNNCGVRQGENLSPLLFSIFLNDLEDYLISEGCNGILINFDSEDIYVYIKLFLFLYADDTVLFADNEYELQKQLDAFTLFCEQLKLNINYNKT